MNDKDTKFHVIPREELKCIWMASGLISYKLCDRYQQCGDCPFDRAMRNEAVTKSGFQESERDYGQGVLENDFSIRIDESVFYHINHCWIKVEKPEKVKVGVDAFFAQFILDAKVVILPEKGEFIDRGNYFAHIIQENNIFPVIFPLSGSIQASNLNLKKKPELIATDPLGEGWLVKVRPENLGHDLKYLLFGKKALSWYQEEERELIALRNSMLKSAQKELGPTMQDGGDQISRLGDILTPEQYSRILDSFVTKPRDLEMRYETPNGERSPLAKKEKE